MFLVCILISNLLLHTSHSLLRFICDVHGVPAVRRRCSHGIHKDRRFYVCGLEKNKRCNYFKWSDNVPELPPTADSTKSQTGGVVNQIVSRTDANNIFVPVFQYRLSLRRYLAMNYNKRGAVLSVISLKRISL